VERAPGTDPPAAAFEGGQRAALAQVLRRERLHPDRSNRVTESGPAREGDREAGASSWIISRSSGGLSTRATPIGTAPSVRGIEAAAAARWRRERR
jgi:hypothetical protein